MKNPSPARKASSRRSCRPGLRAGSVMVLVAICLIPIIACVALAIDFGMLAVAQTQLNDAADAAALAGARTLNGDSANNNNYSSVSGTAQGVLTANKVLGTALQSSQLSLRIGRYTYNTTTQQFEGQFPGPSTENWNMVQATVSGNLTSASMGFAKAFNFSVPNFQAVATAAHRPRDIALILDYSGSMRFGSLLGLDYSTDSRTCNNQDTTYPTWGHYSGTTGMVASSPASPYDDANISWTTSDGRAPVCGDFYTDAAGTKAFALALNAYCTTPGGDIPLRTNKNTPGNPYAKTVGEITNQSSPTTSTRDATFETSGYMAWSMNTAQLKRYTLGPGYYGKTFFLWPPDPSTGADGQPDDWRKRYFYNGGTTTALDDNSRLWDSSGNWRAPGSTTYAINYAAILAWIKSSPCPFPSRLQAGRILYYDAIPDTISTSSWPPSDMNQRFWKDYIDYVLGVVQYGSSSWAEIVGCTGYGDDFTWGTVKITAKSSLTGTPKPYMHYGDNPKRPKLHFWFGPLTMVDFLGNYNLWYSSYVTPDCSRYCWWPGTCHESPLYACKLGIRAALSDVKTNHPNDLMSLIMFCIPKESSSDTAAARFNRVRVGLGRDYASMTEALFYPPSTIGNPSATVRPYDSNNLEVPRAMGGTCYTMGLMLAYNQFSANSSLRSYAAPAGDAGGNGRRGAQKIIIFETDGAPNTDASASWVSAGAGQSYYAIRYNSASPGSSEYPAVSSPSSSTVVANINALCTKLAADESAGGYSSGSRKLLIHCIGFGPQGGAANSTLVGMQQIGNVTDGMPSYKIVDGTESEIITKLQTAITKILQDGVQVSLIQ